MAKHFFFEDEDKKSRQDAGEGDSSKRKIPYKDEVQNVALGGLDIMDEYLRNTKPGQSLQAGRWMVSKTDMDQHITINPDCLPGQAEMIYMAFMYRLVKWHYNFVKVAENVQINPIQAPPFFTLLQVKEKLENQIKQGLSQVSQEVANYELLRSDVRKYGEILDYFVKAKKGDEHVLRSLYVDRVDAHTGEGYSIISMSRRWPTIITDFIRLKEKWNDIETIQKELGISRAQAVVLRTKNEIYKHWKKYFLRDVKERYVRIKNLMESQEKFMDEVANWLIPYVNRYKRINEASLTNPSSDLTNPQIYAHAPFTILNSRFFFWRPIEPEEINKPFHEHDKIDPVDDWVIEQAKKIEEHYGVSFVREYNKNNNKNLPEDDYDSRKKALDALFNKWSDPSARTHEVVSYTTGFMLDRRHIYYAFFDCDYEVDYIKGSQGPLEMEDVYYNIFPANLSINVMFAVLLEVKANEMRFERYVRKLIGTSDVEAEIKAEVDEALKEESEEGKPNKTKKKFSKRYAEWRRRQVPRMDPILKYFRRAGPYETNIKERLSKEYAIYLGGWANWVYDHIKKVCYSMSGVEP